MTEQVVEAVVENTPPPIVEAAQDPVQSDDKVVEEKTTEETVIAAEKEKPEPEPKSKWGDDWRQLMAGDDKAELERLGRFSDPGAVYKSYKEMEKKFKEGLRPPDRPDPSDADAMAEYRKQAGIPENPDDYLKEMKLRDGLQVGEDDQEMVKAFANRLHADGFPPSALASAVDQYYEIQELARAQQEEADSEFRKQAETALREEYGAEYKANITALKQYLGEGEMYDNLMGGRLADGTKLGNNPELIKMLVGKALEANPAATIVPAGPNQVTEINSRIKEIKKMMSEDRDAYFADAEIQAEYAKLLEAQEKFAA